MQYCKKEKEKTTSHEKWVNFKKTLKNFEQKISESEINAAKLAFESTEKFQGRHPIIASVLKNLSSALLPSLVTALDLKSINLGNTIDDLQKFYSDLKSIEILDEQNFLENEGMARSIDTQLQKITNGPEKNLYLISLVSLFQKNSSESKREFTLLQNILDNLLFKIKDGFENTEKNQKEIQNTANEILDIVKTISNQSSKIDFKKKPLFSKSIFTKIHSSVTLAGAMTALLFSKNFRNDPLLNRVFKESLIEMLRESKNLQIEDEVITTLMTTKKEFISLENITQISQKLKELYGDYISRVFLLGCNLSNLAFQGGNLSNLDNNVKIWLLKNLEIIDVDKEIITSFEKFWEKWISIKSKTGSSTSIFFFFINRYISELGLDTLKQHHLRNYLLSAPTNIQNNDFANKGLMILRNSD